MDGCQTACMQARGARPAAARPAAPPAWAAPAAAAAGSTSAPGRSRLAAAAGWAGLPRWAGSAAARPPPALAPQPAARPPTSAGCQGRLLSAALPAVGAPPPLPLRPPACCATAPAAPPLARPSARWRPPRPRSPHPRQRCRGPTFRARQASPTAAALAAAAAAACPPAQPAAQQPPPHRLPPWACGQAPWQQLRPIHRPCRQWLACEGSPSRRSTRHHSWSPLAWPPQTCLGSTRWPRSSCPAHLLRQQLQGQPLAGSAGGPPAPAMALPLLSSAPLAQQAAQRWGPALTATQMVRFDGPCRGAGVSKAAWACPCAHRAAHSLPLGTLVPADDVGDLRAMFGAVIGTRPSQPARVLSGAAWFPSVLTGACMPMRWHSFTNVMKPHRASFAIILFRLLQWRRCGASWHCCLQRQLLLMWRRPGWPAGTPPLLWSCCDSWTARQQPPGGVALSAALPLTCV